MGVGRGGRAAYRAVGRREMKVEVATGLDVGGGSRRGQWSWKREVAAGRDVECGSRQGWLNYFTWNWRVGTGRGGGGRKGRRRWE